MASTLQVSWADPTATDDIDTAIAISCMPSSGSEFQVGETMVTCTATDNAGNTDMCMFTVTVGKWQDNEYCIGLSYFIFKKENNIKSFTCTCITSW